MKLDRLAAAGAALAMLAGCGPRSNALPDAIQDRAEPPAATTPPAPPQPRQSKTPPRSGEPIRPVGPKDTNSQMEGYGGSDLLAPPDSFNDRLTNGDATKDGASLATPL